MLVTNRQLVAASSTLSTVQTMQRLVGVPTTICLVTMPQSVVALTTGQTAVGQQLVVDIGMMPMGRHRLSQGGLTTLLQEMAQQLVVAQVTLPRVKTLLLLVDPTTKPPGKHRLCLAAAAILHLGQTRLRAGGWPMLPTSRVLRLDLAILLTLATALGTALITSA